MWQMGCLFCSVSWAKCKQKSLIPKAKLSTKFNQNLFTSVCNTLLANKQKKTTNAAENRSLLQDVCGLWTFYKYDAGCSLVPLIQQPTHTDSYISFVSRSCCNWLVTPVLSFREVNNMSLSNQPWPTTIHRQHGGWLCREDTCTQIWVCVCVWMCVCVSCTGNACRGHFNRGFQRWMMA